MNVFNGKKCKGLEYSAELINDNLIDAEGLLLSDWDKVKAPEKGWKDSEEGAVARCRDWYDQSGHDSKYCC